MLPRGACGVVWCGVVYVAHTRPRFAKLFEGGQRPLGTPIQFVQPPWRGAIGWALWGSLDGAGAC